MTTTAQKIGGQVVGLAEAHLPNYSFAALVHRGEEVTLYLFKGRLLERSSALAPGSKTLGLFKKLQAEKSVKTGFFKRQSYLTARVCVRARGRKMSAQCDFEDADAYTPSSDDPRAAYTTVLRDDVDDLAKAMFAEPLPQGRSPAEIARTFMADFKACNAYALAESAFEDGEADWNIHQSYDKLIMRYCRPDKAYQGLAYGSTPRHCPDQETITDERVEGDHAFVDTLFTDTKFAHIQHRHTFEFSRDTAEADWRLEEDWYHADAEERLPTL